MLFDPGLGLYGTGLASPPPRPAVGFAPAMRPDDSLPPGYILAGRYRLDEALVLEPHIQIYRALDQTTQEPVKLKRLGPGEDDDDAAYELELLDELKHPRVPKALDAFVEDGRACFVQGYFEGPTLRQRFKAEGPLGRAAMVRVLRSVLEVLAYLHAQRPPVLHRDVKPANLVVMADGEVALIDFDCARRGLVDKAATDPNDLSTAYTLAYAPPEQSIGLEPSPSADVYALAVSMLYAGTGIHPIQHWRAGEGRMRAPERFEPAFAALLDWMMAPGRDARCPSAEAALARLKTIA